jgi:tetratricopeptide (TPR) repeat protein
MKLLQPSLLLAWLPVGLILAVPAAARETAANSAAAGDRACAIESTLAEVDGLMERSFLAPADSVPVYCRGAEAMLIASGGEWPEDARLLSRLALVNARLAEFEGNAEKVERACRTDQYCRGAIARDSTEALPYVLLGVLNYRLSTMGWVERTLARAFVGSLPPASLADSERFLRKAIELRPDSPFYLYALGRTLEALDREAEAMSALRLSLVSEPTTPLDTRYQEKARERLLDLEKPKPSTRESWQELGEEGT